MTRNDVLGLHDYTFTEMKCQFCFLLIIALWACDSDDEDPIGANSDWQKFGSQPVLERGELFSYDFYAISDPFVVFHDGIFKMWYTGGGAVLPDTLLASRICYATSVDGIEWQKYSGNPVLNIRSEFWDSLGVETPTVLIDTAAPPDQRYKMWYAGTTFDGIRYNLGFAHSADGISWTRLPNAVLEVGSVNEWDNFFLEGPTVLQNDQGYHMWYAGYDAAVNGEATDGKVNIGYATSIDGINWEKYSGNPVMTTTDGAWDAVYVQDPEVKFQNGKYHMWYGGTDVGDNYFQQTGYASSLDGINWVKSPNNPILMRGSFGQWDANTASFPAIVIENDQIKMWYTGKDIEPLPEFPQPYFWEIGLATRVIVNGEIAE